MKKFVRQNGGEPVEVNNERKNGNGKVPWLTFALVISLIFLTFAVLFNRQSSLEAKIGTLECSINNINVKIEGIGKDVGWIRQRVDERLGYRTDKKGE